MLKEKGEASNLKALLLSGHGAPDKIVNENMEEMNDEELAQYLLKQGAIQGKFLEEDMKQFFFDLILPPIKADVVLYDKYNFKKSRDKIDVDIVIMNGSKDWKCTKEDINRWQEFAEKTILYYNYDSNHYFINELREECVSDINEIILDTEW